MILYVVAKDYVEGTASDMRGPRAGNGLTKAQIAECLSRHWPLGHLDRGSIDKACTFLLKQNYFELKGGKAGKRYVLHDRYTVPTLIRDRIDARIVLTISELADMDDCFSVDDAIKKCAAEIPGTQDEDIKRRVEALSRTINDVKGYFLPREGGACVINSKTVEEERPYLEFIGLWGFKTPKQAPKRRVHTKKSRAQAKGSPVRRKR